MHKVRRPFNCIHIFETINVAIAQSSRTSCAFVFFFAYACACALVCSGEAGTILISFELNLFIMLIVLLVIPLPLPYNCIVSGFRPHIHCDSPLSQNTIELRFGQACQVFYRMCLE